MILNVSLLPLDLSRAVLIFRTFHSSRTDRLPNGLSDTAIFFILYANGAGFNCTRY
jgi:hypothetical protein